MLGAAVVATAITTVAAIRALESLDRRGDQVAERTRAQVYTPPQPLAAGSEYVETRVLPSGDLRVTHWIHVKGALFTLSVSRPQVSGLPPLTIKDLTVVGNRTAVAPGSAPVGDRPGVFYLNGARHAYVSYVLAGSVERDPAPRGRALAPITSLLVTGNKALSSATYAVIAPQVLNLACSAASPVALPQPCGAPDGRGWRVTLSGSDVDDRVMAQLDLS
jgi:hypothetical protein